MEKEEAEEEEEVTIITRSTVTPMVRSITSITTIIIGAVQMLAPMEVRSITSITIIIGAIPGFQMLEATLTETRMATTITTITTTESPKPGVRSPMNITTITTRNGSPELIPSLTQVMELIPGDLWPARAVAKVKVVQVQADKAQQPRTLLNTMRARNRCQLPQNRSKW